MIRARERIRRWAIGVAAGASRVWRRVVCRGGDDDGNAVASAVPCAEIPVGLGERAERAAKALAAEQVAARARAAHLAGRLMNHGMEGIGGGTLQVHGRRPELVIGATGVSITPPDGGPCEVMVLRVTDREGSR